MLEFDNKTNQLFWETEGFSAKGNVNVKLANIKCDLSQSDDSRFKLAVSADKDAAFYIEITNTCSKPIRTPPRPANKSMYFIDNVK